MLARRAYADPQPPPSGLSDCIATQLAGPVEAFVSRRVQPIADEITAAFREQAARLLATRAATLSTNALALVGRAKRALVVARRVVLAQADISLSEQRVVAQAFGIEADFLRFLQDSVDAVFSRCRATAADEIRPVLEQVFLDGPMREVAGALALLRAKVPLAPGAARLGNSPVAFLDEAEWSFGALRTTGTATFQIPFSPFATTRLAGRV